MRSLAALLTMSSDSRFKRTKGSRCFMFFMSECYSDQKARHSATLHVLKAEEGKASKVGKSNCDRKGAKLSNVSNPFIGAVAMLCS